jgi:hypothetical protein
VVSLYCEHWDSGSFKAPHLPIEEVAYGCVLPIPVINVARDNKETHQPIDRLADKVFECISTRRCNPFGEIFIGGGQPKKRAAQVKVRSMQKGKFHKR